MSDEHDVLPGELICVVELLAEVFAARSIRYAVIGGLATLLRGRPRFTQDVDVLLDLPQLALPGLLDDLTRRGFTLDAATVMREYTQEHITAFRYRSVRIDWLKPMLPLYARTLADASSLTWTEGCQVRVAAAEGLILTKMVSFRPQVQADIETLLIANRDEIDVGLVRQQWSEVAQGEEAHGLAGRRPHPSRSRPPVVWPKRNAPARRTFIPLVGASSFVTGKAQASAVRSAASLARASCVSENAICSRVPPWMEA